MLALIAIFPCVRVCAQNNDNNADIAFSTEMWNNYLGENGVVFYDGPVYKLDFVASNPNGTYVQILDIKGKNAHDLSFTLGWDNDYVDAWGSYGRISERDGSSVKKNWDAFEASIEVKKDFKPSRRNTLTPFARIHYYVLVPREDRVRPWTEGGLRYSFDGKTLELDSSISMLYDAGNFGYMPGWVGRYEIRAKWKLGKHFAIDLPLITGTHPFMHDLVRKNEVSYGGGITIIF